MPGTENDKNSLNFYPSPADFDQHNPAHPTSIFDPAVPLASTHSSVRPGVAFNVDYQGFELKKRGDEAPAAKSSSHGGGIVLDFTENDRGACRKAEAFSIDAGPSPGAGDAQGPSAATMFQRRMEERQRMLEEKKKAKERQEEVAGGLEMAGMAKPARPTKTKEELAELRKQMMKRRPAPAA